MILKYFPKWRRDPTENKLKKLANNSLRIQEEIIGIERHVIVTKDPIQKAYLLDKKQSLEKSLKRIDEEEQRVVGQDTLKSKNETKYEEKQDPEDFEDEMVLKSLFADKKSEKSKVSDNIVGEEHIGLEFPITGSRHAQQEKTHSKYGNLWSRIQRPLKYAAAFALVMAFTTTSYYSGKNIRNYCNGADTKKNTAYRTFDITPEFIEGWKIKNDDGKKDTVAAIKPKETPTITPEPIQTPKEKETMLPEKTGDLEKVVSKEELNGQHKKIEVYTVKNWGLSNYALINMGFASFEELNKIDGRARTALHNKLNMKQRKLVRIETDLIYEMNKNNAGFRAGNKDYVRNGAKITMNVRVEKDLRSEYASISVGTKPMTVSKEVIETREKKTAKVQPGKGSAHKEIKKAEFNRAGQKCAGDYTEKKSAGFSKAYYYDTNNYNNAMIYGSAYPKIRSELEKYAGSNGNNSYTLMEGINKILYNLPITKDAGGRLRIKPPVGVDGKPVPGTWVSNGDVCGMLNALRDDLWAYSTFTKNEAFIKKFKEDMPWVETQFSAYKRTLGLIQPEETPTLTLMRK